MSLGGQNTAKKKVQRRLVHLTLIIRGMSHFELGHQLVNDTIQLLIA